MLWQSDISLPKEESSPLMTAEELEDKWRQSHMNSEVIVNLDEGEPKEAAPHFLSKLEAGLCLQRFVDVQRTWKKYSRAVLPRTFCNDGSILYLNSPTW